MSDSIKPEVSPDFTVVVVDGIYFQVINNGVALQFYRDVSIPSHDKFGIPTFPNKERTILHETRMTLETAKRVSSDIEKGLQAWEREVDRKSGYAKLRIQLDEIVKNMESKPEKEAEPVFQRILGLMQNVTIEGQRKIVRVLDELIEKNGDKFEEIITAHSIKRIEGK